MTHQFSRRSWIGGVLGAGIAGRLFADEAASPSVHPLDPIIAQAESSFAKLQEITDYTCILVRRERLGGKLSPHIFQEARVRQRKIEDGRTTVPFSVFLRFLKPVDVAGREVLWMEGKNNGKMRVKEPPVLGLPIPALWLEPDGSIALSESKYPITSLGIENLCRKLVERSQTDRDRKRPEECEVKIMKGAKVDGRLCTMMALRHTEKRPEYEFQGFEVFFDQELQVPIRFAAYGFPPEGEDKPTLEEEYTYTRIKLNTGLGDADFQ